MLFLILGVLLASVVALVLILELRSYSRCMFYRKQGLLVHYTPFVPAFLSRLLKGTKLNNQLAYVEEDYRQAKALNAPVVVYNMRACASTYIVDMALIREFFTKETDVSVKETPVSFHQSFGFIFEGLAIGLEHRAIFTEFFKIDKLNLVVPKVYNAVKQALDKLPIGADGKAVF